MLEIKNLTIGYRSGRDVTRVVEGINATLHPGELVCLLGANGKGKSTLLRTLAGTQDALEGSVRIDGKVVQDISKRELARLLSLVYTDNTLAGGLSVRELVELGRHPHTGFLGILSDEDRRRVQDAMQSVGIAHKSSSFVAELSDGERQKAMIARAVAQETPVIFLDEPTAFLDVASKSDTMRLLHDLARDEQKAILLSTHDVSQALSLADRLWIIDRDGEFVSGLTEDMVLNGSLQRLFEDTRTQFDITSGAFVSRGKYTRTVSLECTDLTVRRWLTNALHRNGFEISEEAKVCIRYENGLYSVATHSCTSVEELLGRLLGE